MLHFPISNPLTLCHSNPSNQYVMKPKYRDERLTWLCTLFSRISALILPWNGHEDESHVPGQLKHHSIIFQLQNFIKQAITFIWPLLILVLQVLVILSQLIQSPKSWQKRHVTDVRRAIVGSLLGNSYTNYKCCEITILTIQKTNRILIDCDPADKRT